MREYSIELVPGSMLQDRYRIGSMLGAGGFGITYEAVDELNNLTCAIKEYAPMDIAMRLPGEPVMMPQSSEKQQMYEHGMKRFMEEAEILKSLQNVKAVVTITDYFYENGTCYFVMEYVDGITVKALMKGNGGSLPLEQALPIIYEVGISMQRVHEQCNIYHRDISPDNIMITNQGEIKIIDFGNSKHIMNDGRESRSVVLKPGYAPYEQYFSKAEQGTYTDVYSLAAAFYHVIAGKMLPTPHERLSGTKYIKLVDMELGIPQYISEAFDHALAVLPKERTQSMYQFLTELALVETTGLLRVPPEIDTEATTKALRKLEDDPRERGEDCSKQVADTPYIDIMIDGGAFKRYVLPVNQSVVLGKSLSQAQIILEGDEYVSRKHCEIFYDSIEDAFYIQDYSSNGTYINGMRLEYEKIYILQQDELFTVANQVINMKVGIMHG